MDGDPLLERWPIAFQRQREAARPGPRASHVTYVRDWSSVEV